MTTDAPILPLAASAILLRERPADADHEETFEVYLLRRPANAAFAPGMHSFPGGVLDPEDLDCAPRVIHTRSSGLPLERVHARLTGTGPFDPSDLATSAALIVCATRELFEETMVLLARDSTGALATPTTAIADEREALLRGTREWEALLNDHALTIAPDDLIYYSHWITPEGRPIRYNTFFFIALLPPGQEPSHWAGEMESGEWLAPRAALARYAAGSLPMFTPQLRHLERFATYDTLAAFLDHARTKRALPVLGQMQANGREAVLPEELARCW